MSKPIRPAVVGKRPYKTLTKATLKKHVDMLDQGIAFAKFQFAMDSRFSNWFDSIPFKKRSQKERYAFKRMMQISYVKGAMSALEYACEVAS